MPRRCRREMAGTKEAGAGVHDSVAAVSVQGEGDIILKLRRAVDKVVTRGTCMCIGIQSCVRARKCMHTSVRACSLKDESTHT